MYINQGRKRRWFTTTQLWMMAVGSGYVVAGWMRWPDELKSRVIALAWSIAARCVPW